MTAKNITFTKKELESLQPPATGRLYIRDVREKGLSAYITSTGSITFFIRKRVHGRDERVILGRYPEISIENARKLALKAKAEIAQGIDPNEEKKKLRADITFGELFQEFMERYSKKHKKSWAYDEREVQKFLSHWFKRRISQISKQEIQLLHEKIHDQNGLYQANRLLERIRAIYNKAIEWGWDGTNPTTGIKKYKEKSRDRFLRSDELPRFFAALAEEENETARDYIMISLLTGARKSNVLAMKWDEINFSLGEWQIPETKNGDSHRIPLSPAIMEILAHRKTYANNKYVFPGSGTTGHLADPKKAWQRILKSAEIEDLRLHDLRRTLGSWMAASGATTAIIGKTLAHKSQQATKIYERLDLDPVRLSVNAAHQAIFTAAGIQDKG